MYCCRSHCYFYISSRDSKNGANSGHDLCNGYNGQFLRLAIEAPWCNDACVGILGRASAYLVATNDDLCFLSVEETEIACYPYDNDNGVLNIWRGSSDAL